MEQSQLAPIPLVPLFSVSLFLLLLSPHRIRNIFPTKKTVNIPKKMQCNCRGREKKKSQVKKRLIAPVRSEFLQKTKTDILSFPPFPPPVVSKDVQRNGTIVKSESHLHVSDSCSGAREKRRDCTCKLCQVARPFPI